MSNCSTVMTKMLLLLFRLLRITLLSPRIFSLFLNRFRGAPKIDLPLSMFSLAKTVLTLMFSDSTLLVGETKIVVLKEAILGEEKSYPKPIQSKANFCKLGIQSSFALEVLSS